MIKSLTCDVIIGQIASPPCGTIRAQLDIDSGEILREASPFVSQESHVVPRAATETRRPDTFVPAAGPAVTV